MEAAAQERTSVLACVPLEYIRPTAARSRGPNLRQTLVPAGSVGVMPPDFLNSREDALLLWFIVIVGYASYASAKSGGGLGSSFGEVLRSFFLTKLIFVFGSAAAYAALVVLAAERLGLWHTTALRETIYWFGGTSFVLVGDGISAKTGESFMRMILRRAVAFTIMVEFLVNLYVFPFLVEVVLVPLVLVFVLMQAYAPYDSNVTATTRKSIDGVLVALGMFLLATF